MESIIIYIAIIRFVKKHLFWRLLTIKRFIIQNALFRWSLNLVCLEIAHCEQYANNCATSIIHSSVLQFVHCTSAFDIGFACRWFCKKKHFLMNFMLWLRWFIIPTARCKSACDDMQIIWCEQFIDFMCKKNIAIV